MNRPRKLPFGERLRRLFAKAPPAPPALAATLAPATPNRTAPSPAAESDSVSLSPTGPIVGLRRVIAIDWSGDAAGGGRKKIWLAEVAGGELARLEGGRTRGQIADHLLALARRDPRFVVGLDFAFSLPAWFLRSREIESAADLWALAEREAEDWLATCRHPFWGRPGVGKPRDLPGEYRCTDIEVPSVGGVRPKSVFQIGGAGAVGTGSLRGRPLLHALRRAGFSIWPFHAPGWPLVVEIYPRALTGAVVKSSAAARAAYLARHCPDLPEATRAPAAESEDAFAAAVSALVMARHARSFADLRPTADPTFALEGRFWRPT
jgi:hypothetical protein